MAAITWSSRRTWPCWPSRCSWPMPWCPEPHCSPWYVHFPLQLGLRAGSTGFHTRKCHKAQQWDSNQLHWNAPLYVFVLFDSALPGVIVLINFSKLGLAYLLQFNSQSLDSSDLHEILVSFAISCALGNSWLWGDAHWVFSLHPRELSQRIACWNWALV